MTDNNKDHDAPDSSGYTHEQKIVAAVWVHERAYNHQSWKDIRSNFKIRFNMPAPEIRTLMNWEQKLFKVGSLETRKGSGRPVARLMHVPYVKESLKEKPDLSVRERAKLLGLTTTTLLKIMRDDLNMEFQAKDEDGSCMLNKKHAKHSGGWKTKSDQEQEQKRPEMKKKKVIESSCSDDSDSS